MANYEFGPSSLPSVAQREVSANLRRRDLIGTNSKRGSFTEFGTFQMRDAASELQRYVMDFWSSKLLNFDPNKQRIEKSADRSLFIVDNNLGLEQAQSEIERFNIQLYDKFILPSSDVRIVNRSSSGQCDVDEDGNLHYIDDQKSNIERFISVPTEYVGKQVFLVVFDAIPVNVGGKQRLYNPRDGVVIYKDPSINERVLLPRLVRGS